MEKSYHHGNLRHELIETGIDIINEEGIKGFSLRKLAAKCGVSHAAPYAHFQDIDDLVHAMGQHVTDRFMEQLSASMEEQEAGVQAIHQLGIAYISFFLKNPQYFQFVFYNANIVIDLDQTSDKDYAPFTLFRKAAYKMFEDVGMPREQHMKTLLSIWSLVHGIAALSTTAGIKYSGDWTEIYKFSRTIGGNK